jgi:UDP-N-acetylmuramyl pentapeptide phosphotransferase/UDP-N-acetylglucosamine-1-phosphate transferase
MAGGVSLVLAMLLVLTQQWHGHWSMDSTVGVQKFHTSPTPRVGGIAIVAAMLAGTVLARPDHQSLMWPLMLASTPAFGLGLLEDLTKRVSVRARLLATMACGVVGWAITGLSITDANVPGLDWLLGYTAVSVAFTAFAVGGVANAINIIDGFNGLASGVAIIVLTSFSIMATAQGDPVLANISLMLAGAVLGFGMVNWPLGKIFLGDGGAYFVGFALAWLAVLMLARHPEVSAWAPTLACGYPLLEVVFSIRRRWRCRRSAGEADSLHLHSLVKRRVVRHLLPHASKRVRNSVTGAFMWSAALLPAVIAVNWPTDTSVLVVSFVICAFLYSAVYARLTQFRWCLRAIMLHQLKTA